MFKYPKAQFVTDLRSEAEYICFLARGIRDGKYQKAGFMVIPYLVAGNPKSVYFPDLSYSDQFWSLIGKNPHADFGKGYPEKAVKEIETKLIQTKDSKISSVWSEKEVRFWQLCGEFLDLKKVVNKIDKIKILITNYGTSGSYYPFYLSTRLDMGAENIPYMILLSLYNIALRDSSEIGEINWYQRQAVVNFLIKKTAFSNLFSKIPTQAIAPKNIYDSNNYLTKLGFPTSPVQNYDKLAKTLTLKERLIFNLLKDKGDLISFDEIGDGLWAGQEDKFSLYAIAKLVEGVRRKMRSVGLDSSYLKTIKGQGYFLMN